jgi:CCR4-NOT transcription complex subunit 4
MPSIASSHPRPKATGQVDNGTSTSYTKITLVQKARGSCITVPRSHPVSQNPEEPAHLLASATASVKSHAGVEIKNECSDISENLVLGDHKQLPESTVSHRSTEAQSMSDRTLPGNLSASYAKTQGSAGPHNLSDLNIKLVAQNQSTAKNINHLLGDSSASTY